MKKVSPAFSMLKSQVKNLSAWLLTILANLEGEKMQKSATEIAMAITKNSEANEISVIFSPFFIFLW
ncbi:MAG: hypothetical protein PUB29_04985 [Bacteroidales bacterium]|nr:hypothetical protein [Bacteroidales bacterium]